MIHLDSHLPDLQGVGEGIEPQVIVCLIHCRDGHCLENSEEEEAAEEDEEEDVIQK